MPPSSDKRAGLRSAEWDARLRWVMEYGDALLLVTVGALFAVMGLLNALKGDPLTEATLGLLALIGLASLRDRAARIELQASTGELNESVRRAQETVEAIRSGANYVFLVSEITWDLHDPSGGAATMYKRRKIRFLRDWVSTMWDQSDETNVVEYTTTDQRYQQFAEFTHNGRHYYLISLGGFWQRGRETEVTIVRKLVGSFPAESEDVTVNADAMIDTHHLRMRVVWPPGRPPIRVWLQVHLEETEIPLTELRLADGRAVLERDFPSPQQGNSYTINWQWAPYRENVEVGRAG